MPDRVEVKAAAIPPDSFPTIRFGGTLRPSQEEAFAIARRAYEGGKRRLHIVAPPGSGKTILGLALWAGVVRRRALVLSPNSAIQSQWRERVRLFASDLSLDDLVSTDAESSAWLASLTYQSVTLPSRGDADLEAAAVALWTERLIESGEARDPEEAAVWIRDLARHNSAYYAERLSFHMKAARDAITLHGDTLRTLHASAIETIERLCARGVGMIILDECHHLMGHWGRVLAAIEDLFEDPVILGLTATPPDETGRLGEDVERYRAFFGPVDFEVPIPAVVKDGFLAPYQDLVQFVRPEPEELSWIAGVDAAFEELLRMLETPATAEEPAAPLCEWVFSVLGERRRWLGGATVDWQDFERSDPAFAQAARRFFQGRRLALPEGVPSCIETDAASMDGAGHFGRQVDDTAFPSEAARRDAFLETLVVVLDRYVRHYLRKHPSPAARELAETVIRRLRLLGYQITETAVRAAASPVARVLSWSRAKMRAIVPILLAERAALGDRIRAVVITDFEKRSAQSDGEAGLLDQEAGGAVAAFRALLTDPGTDALDPVLVTGSTVLVDDDLAARFGGEIRRYLEASGASASFEYAEEEGFKVMRGSGPDWSPRLYVGLITDLFQRGVTRCLVGTRGLLGEGWDASKINVLIDLTTVTTSMTVNQVRGRSIRLDPEDPLKVANNWDVVCIAPEFMKGFEDYRRFTERHGRLFGVTDDGAIEKGVGHVHAAFTEIEPEGIEETAAIMNAEMLARAARREETRKLWRIGEPYHPDPIHALERRGGGGGGFPPFAGGREAWSDDSLTASIARALCEALADAGLVGRRAKLHVAGRAGGYTRAFLESATPEESRLFAESLAEIFSPPPRPRYVIPRYVDRFDETFLSRLLPEIVGRFFRQGRRDLAMLHAVPLALGRSKDLVAHFQRYWNMHVSPGEAVYALQGKGEEWLEECRAKGLAPTGVQRVKEVFL